LTTTILGLSAYYHDSAAALLIDGKIIAAAQEERFSRKKLDARFPAAAVTYCLGEAGIELCDVDYVVFYDKPLVKFRRLLSAYLAYVPTGFRSFSRAMPIWLKDKLFLKSTLRRELASLGKLDPVQIPRILFSEHHESHAASAFYPSPFEKAAVLCLDGVGEWATTSVWLGDKNRLEAKWQINFPHSLGLLYSAFTAFSGFRVNFGEYKLMGLAPYGIPKYVDEIFGKLMDLKDDGTFRLDMSYFNYAAGLSMTTEKFNRLFGGPPRMPESEITQREMDLASSVQYVTEEVVMRLASTVKNELEVDNLCLAGGVALNCVANGRLLREGPFQNIWIQPAAGDAGGALGASMAAWYRYLEKPRNIYHDDDQMKGTYLGPQFSNDEISDYLNSVGAPYRLINNEKLLPKVAELIESGKVIGWFNGRMEFGPRALGARSILGDPRNPKMQSIMNLKIKYRESFRPFAPAVLADHAPDWFEIDRKSPYMLLVSKVNKNKCTEVSEEDGRLIGIKRLNIVRSEIPAVTHVDNSARIQTVHKETNPRFYKLIEEFYVLTGCPVLVNTSFNVRGEPIVATPEDAYRCFMRTEMDYLVMENILLSKQGQPPFEFNDSWQENIELD
jgi:carbamoyltransferase